MAKRMSLEGFQNFHARGGRPLLISTHKMHRVEPRLEGVDPRGRPPSQPSLSTLHTNQGRERVDPSVGGVEKSILSSGKDSILGRESRSAYPIAMDRVRVLPFSI